MYFVTQGIQKYGVPRRICFDNGSQYRTHWMKRACGLLGIRLLYADQQVDVVYDPQNIAKVRIEDKGHEPFYAEPAKVGTRVGKKPKRAEIDRIPADSSRLLNAISRTSEERERRAVISYTKALEDDENVWVVLWNEA